ncbi:hypothetical protein E2C01_095523 [Portunus trituberculatus]|uniref:Uncharacterized protein n=1 Tax=Portunus trituberculatus TaxID=210409 RepID=A0A5B7K5Z5_PORTR|nr:hypothetical protein [Portunus trituberculatus]
MLLPLLRERENERRTVTLSLSPCHTTMAPVFPCLLCGVRRVEERLVCRGFRFSSRRSPERFVFVVIKAIFT